MCQLIDIRICSINYSNRFEIFYRILEDWQTKNLADDVFMLKHQIEELIKLLVSVKDTLPHSYTSIGGFLLSSLQR